jgi:catechol 2,3-dioxygenase-like lactoylglutathione lyase family enzyme
MKLMPIVYITDMDTAIEFYTALGMNVGNKGRSNMWTELEMGDFLLALHHIDPLPANQIGRVELAMVAEMPLEDVVNRLKENGIVLERDITDEAFGRSILVRDPDGLPIQINEHEVELYT